MKSRKPSIPYIIWMVVFTMIPIIMIGFTAFTDKNGNFSLQAFTNAFYYTNIFVGLRLFQRQSVLYLHIRLHTFSRE